METSQRSSSHKIETNSKNNVRRLIDQNGTGLYREMTDRDYGIDAIMELFDDDKVTGKFALLQIKGRENKIIPLTTDSSVVSCKISSSNATYASQKNIPVFVILASLKEENNFYYVELQNALTDEHREKLKDGQKSITIHIPINSCVVEKGIQAFFDIVNSFYDR